MELAAEVGHDELPAHSSLRRRRRNAARAVIGSACDALKELGPRPRRPDARAVLKKTVIWFNEADEKAGGVIETEEREDICTVLEEMAYVARQKALVEEIDEWREW